jgi:hypothetical protein
MLQARGEGAVQLMEPEPGKCKISRTGRNVEQRENLLQSLSPCRRHTSMRSRLVEDPEPLVTEAPNHNGRV